MQPATTDVIVDEVVAVNIKTHSPVTTDSEFNINFQNIICWSHDR